MAAGRRLAAIMFTDTVGFTSSTQSDEAAALRLLREQEQLLQPILAAHQGRSVKSTGDGLLAEFDSALKATQCAIAFQRLLHERNTPGDRPAIRIRIGIHLGDVEPQGSDILGDAVNIAARIEPLAEPGGICLSSSVYDQVWNKISDPLEKLPPKALKGVRMATDVYRLLLPWELRPSGASGVGSTGLAVLPFSNISPDPSDEYFADGLTEELITVLSQRSGLRVIARTSVLPYKATTKGVAQIGSELRVSSILEGSVRKAGTRLRVTAQLIDVATEGHLWAQTYDRELDDVFRVQSDLAGEVTDALQVKLAPNELERIETRHAVQSPSYLAYLKGLTLTYKTDLTNLRQARALFEEAIRLDPKNAAAIAELADTVRVIGWWYPEASAADWDAESKRLAARAAELDPNRAETHASLALIHWDDCDYIASEREFLRAISLSPSDPKGHFGYAAILEDMGRMEEALTELALAEAADPVYPHLLGHHAHALISAGKLDEAREKAERLQAVEPDANRVQSVWVRYYLAKGDRARALDAATRGEAVSTDPHFVAVFRAFACILKDDPDGARAILREQDALPLFTPTVPMRAMAYAELHDVDGAIRVLEPPLRQHVPISWQTLRTDPRFAQVRADPRFEAMLKQANLA